MNNVLVLTGLLALSLGHAQGCDDGFRRFDHDLLTTEPVCVPENPQRVAVLDLSALEVAATLGVSLVAVLGFGRDFIARTNPDGTVDVAGLTAASADVGSPVNLEALLGARPDLIIAAAWAAEPAGHAALAQIAPTVVYDEGSRQDWRAGVHLTAAALGRAAAGEQLAADFGARAAVFRRLVRARGVPTDVSVVNLQADAAHLRIAGAFADTLVRSLGLTRPEAQRRYDAAFTEGQNAGVSSLEVSLERLPLVDASHLFVYSADQDVRREDEARRVLERLREDPLWRTLTAVQEGRLVVVGSHWQGFGVFEAHRVLDDLFRHVAGVDPAEVAPNPFTTGPAERTRSD